ncbi:hypothetical protein Tco_1385057 [Tanacetum coccineum]
MDSEDKEKGSKKKARGSRKKTLARKRAGEKQSDQSTKRQKTEYEKEKEELKAYLDLVSREEFAMEIESLDTKAYKGSKNYKIFSEMLDDFDRYDVMDLHRLVEKGSIPINRGLIQAIPTSLPPQLIGEEQRLPTFKEFQPGKVHIFYIGLDIPTRKILESNGFIPLMTPTQALESIQVMAGHSHNWYDETTTMERINNVLDNVDAIHEIFKGELLNREYSLKKENKAIKPSRYMESLEETIIKFYEDTIKK